MNLIFSLKVSKQGFKVPREQIFGDVPGNDFLMPFERIKISVSKLRGHFETDMQ
jgi:hypothetical protein